MQHWDFNLLENIRTQICIFILFYSCSLFKIMDTTADTSKTPKEKGCIVCQRNDSKHDEVDETEEYQTTDLDHLISTVLEQKTKIESIFNYLNSFKIQHHPTHRVLIHTKCCQDLIRDAEPGNVLKSCSDEGYSSSEDLMLNWDKLVRHDLSQASQKSRPDWLKSCFFCKKDISSSNPYSGELVPFESFRIEMLRVCRQRLGWNERDERALVVQDDVLNLRHTATWEEDEGEVYHVRCLKGFQESRMRMRDKRCKEGISLQDRRFTSIFQWILMQ